MSVSAAIKIWSRAAVDAGGPSARPGDRALASLLRFHGDVMNGGVHHALECLTSDELVAAADGYAYFGFAEVAAFIRGAAFDPILRTWNDDTEPLANRRYDEMIPDDQHLMSRFEQFYRDRVHQFAPVNHEL